MARDPLTRYTTLVFDSARWEGFAFRPGDIVISTPPKCGTTWMQMICALLVFQDPALPAPLARISPWLDMLTRPLDDVVADLEAQTHRRFIKSHTPFDGLPYDETAVYVCVARDPRDVGLSWDNHLANMDLAAFLQLRAEAVGLDDLAEVLPEIPPPPPEDPVERFRLWVEERDMSAPTYALQHTLHHLVSFWEQRSLPNVFLFHYADLKTDLEGEMRRLAGLLGISVPEERWPVLVEAASFEAMKARADELAPNADQGLWQDNGRFFDRGRSGGWRDLLGDADLARYEERVAELAPPDLAAWVHAGWRGAAPVTAEI